MTLEQRLAAFAQAVATKIKTLPANTVPWSYYASNWSAEPALMATISSGEVYSYVLGGTTRYRLVPNPYTPASDAFYSTFSNGACSGLIVRRNGATT